MKIKALLIVFTVLMLFGVSAEAQSLPRRVRNVEVQDLDAKKARLPWWGEKNLMIFYVDPDVPKQNDAFITHIEETKRLVGPNIEGFGIINLKDTMFPNAIVRFLARKRTEKNGATIITDENNIIAKEWGLGDCNNMFVLMIVSREGDLVFCHKGEMTKQDQDDFIRIVADYR